MRDRAFRSARVPRDLQSMVSEGLALAREAGRLLSEQFRRNASVRFGQGAHRRRDHPDRRVSAMAGRTRSPAGLSNSPTCGVPCRRPEESAAVARD